MNRWETYCRVCCVVGAGCWLPVVADVIIYLLVAHLFDVCTAVNHTKLARHQQRAFVLRAFEPQYT